MTKLTRIVAVAVGIAAFGLMFTAVAFQWLGAANSGESMLGLASVLAVGNFCLLRQGMRWAGRPAFEVSPARGRGRRTSAPLGIPATN